MEAVVKLKPETIAAHKERKQCAHATRTPEHRPATLEEKQAWLASTSRGFTRGLFHNVPIERLPLYHNGHDFYIMTM